MKAGEKSLLKYLDGNDQEFVIPVFQRRYDWRIEQCKRLWEDLVLRLESPVVILWGLDAIDLSNHNELLYVGMSRANHY